MAKLFLMDGHSILNRAYYGLPDLTNSKGLHTNAVYGFLNMMFRFLDAEKPDYFAVAFDVHEPTFRHKMYADYKGTRHAMDPELREQVPMIQEMLQAMGIPTVKKGGLEADDILGTLSVMGEERGMDVAVMSGDRDLLQLATGRVKIIIPKTKQGGTVVETYYAKDVLEQKGVTPQEFIDVKALWGDTADNIPGVPSIGEKTATAIIQAYHTVENAHDHLDEIKPPRAQKNLGEFYDQAILSKKLATIEVHAEFDFDMEDAKVHDYYTEEAFQLCKEWEFKNLLPRFEGEHAVAKEMVDVTKLCTLMTSYDSFSAAVQEMIDGATSASSASQFEVDNNEAGASETATSIMGAYLGVSLGAVDDHIEYLAVSDGEKAVSYHFLPLEASYAESLLTKIFDATKNGVKLCLPDIKLALHYINRDASYYYDDNACQATGNGYPAFYDVSVAAYLLDPLKSDYPMDEIGQTMNLSTPSYEELFGKEKREKVLTSESDETEKKVSGYIGAESLIAVRAREELNHKLQEQGATDLYQQMELPLVFTLSDMEKVGMAMDRDALISYGEELQKTILELEQRIYDAAGEEFNINSPKQLGQILFEKMGIQGGKKTKTGYSTAADVLEALAPENPIVSDILTYRKYTKLKSTYVDGLSECVASDGRVHSTFQQRVTATGRISSTEPNLQNIPIRMELGKKIRKVFYAKEGTTFLDADYSQIELRVLAHLSEDENLIQAYRDGQDIHRSTASRVFHTPFEEVTDLQRRNAKAVNFGIVYGISAYGLSQDLQISTKEAKEYIDSYYEAYPKLKIYIEGLVDSAKKCGYASTMFGRRRPIPELSSSNFMTRQFGERVAMNSPVQGTAADIIKLAMVHVHDRLLREQLKSRLVLQVHDELLIEADLTELSQVRTILKEEMENAAHLLVDLEIDMEEGENWYDAK